MGHTTHFTHSSCNRLEVTIEMHLSKIVLIVFIIIVLRCQEYYYLISYLDFSNCTGSVESSSKNMKGTLTNKYTISTTVYFRHHFKCT